MVKILSDFFTTPDDIGLGGFQPSFCRNNLYSFLLQKVLLAAAVRCLCQLFAGSGPHQKVAWHLFRYLLRAREIRTQAAWQRVRISIYLFPKENRCSVQARSICRCRHHARTSAMSIFFDSRRQAKNEFQNGLGLFTLVYAEHSGYA